MRTTSRGLRDRTPPARAVTLDGFPRPHAPRRPHRPPHPSLHRGRMVVLVGRKRAVRSGGHGSGSVLLAERPIGAWVEVFRKTMLIPDAEVAARSLFSVALPGRDLRLADLTSRRAPGFGVTASLGANEEYARSHAFAVAAAQAGFDGMRYLVSTIPRSACSAWRSSAGRERRTRPIRTGPRAPTRRCRTTCSPRRGEGSVIASCRRRDQGRPGRYGCQSGSGGSVRRRSQSMTSTNASAGQARAS